MVAATTLTIVELLSFFFGVFLLRRPFVDVVDGVGSMSVASGTPAIPFRGSGFAGVVNRVSFFGELLVMDWILARRA